MPTPPTLPATPEHAPVPKQPKRTIVSTVPPPAPGDSGQLRAGRAQAQAQRDAGATTMPVAPPINHAPTDPGLSSRPTQARATAEDFQEARYKHTQMAGVEGLSEPAADQPRIRLIPGKVVPGTRYRITRWLGEGGMGVVYGAEHVDIERQVALKILRFDLSQEAKMAQVFRDEARAASRIGSKNIVEIYDFGELSDGRLFFCMEMIPGGDLVPPTEEDWIEPARLIGLLRQICKGLSAAHKSGIVHRDIKPENIILVNDEEQQREVVKIVDFGISAMLAAGQDDGNTIAGTPHYMAPEQITGTKFDGRLDIYAMGCMAYELLVGYPPFLAEGIQELLQQQLYEIPKPLEDCRPDREIPQELADVIMKCLEKEPEARWQSMDDLEAALCEAQIAAGLTTPWDDLPLPDVDPERRARLVAGMPNPNQIIIEKKRWGIAAIAAAVALVLGVGVTWALVSKPTDEDINQIDALTAEARTAASKTQWIYKPDDDPEAPTALEKVRELEELEGSADRAGDERAEELRTEFGQTLNSLGDRYWDSPSGQGFAREYYAMALLFDPDDKEAFERSGLTHAQLADFRERAAKNEFTEAERSAARWLDVLAEEDKVLAAEKAEALLAMELEAARSKGKSAGSLLVQSRALDAARGAGIAVTNGVPPPEPSPIVPEDEDTGDELDLEGETEGETEGEPEADTGGPKRPGGKRPRHTDGDEKLGANARDPGKAAALAEQGMAALKAGKRNEAKNLFNQAISYDQRNAMALMGLSDVFFDTGSSQKAVLYAEKAVKAAPKNANYRIKLGDAYYAVLRYRDALDEYKKAKSYGASKADARIAKVKSKIGG